jgi:hypothetical protein
MDTFSAQDLKALIKNRNDYCLSIYLPTYRYGPEVRHNAVRFRKLIDVSWQLLMKGGMKGSTADTFIAPARQLLQNASFWEHPADGIALFLSKKVFRYFRVPSQLREQVLIAQEFFIRPMIPLLHLDKKFYVLALSENNARILQASMQDVTELQVEAMPRSLQDAMRFNTPERQLQYHTGTPKIPGSRGGAIFHGHGVVMDSKEELLEYCRQVDRALHRTLRTDKAPLILAAVDHLWPLYRKMNTYAHLLKDGIPGNPDLLSDEELHSRGLTLMSSYFEQEKSEAFAQYLELRGTDLVSHNIEEIMSAARQGKTRSVFVNGDSEWWGKFDPKTEKIEPHDTYIPGDQEIVNLVVLETLLHRGSVYTLKPAIANEPMIFAVYRY